MPGDESGLTPDAAPVGDSDKHTRIEDKKKFAGKPEMQGVPDDEHVEDADVEERLDEDPEDVSANRRDVPDTPENSFEARTEDG